jgi:GNAT superfamily N-acetyltransferase
LIILLRDGTGNVVGGIKGETYWGWLYVENLSVKKSLRKQGLGKKLLEQAEREAISRGCKFAYLDTFSFQALPFYEKQGYAIFGSLKDFPKGNIRYFLKKELPTTGK